MLRLATLCAFAVLALFSVGVGVHDLYRKNALTNFNTKNESLKWLAISWALHEAMPGMVFAGYAFLPSASLLKIAMCLRGRVQWFSTRLPIASRAFLPPLLALHYTFVHRYSFSNGHALQCNHNEYQSAVMCGSLHRVVFQISGAGTAPYW